MDRMDRMIFYKAKILPIPSILLIFRSVCDYTLFPQVRQRRKKFGERDARVFRAADFRFAARKKRGNRQRHRNPVVAERINRCAF